MSQQPEEDILSNDGSEALKNFRHYQKNQEVTFAEPLLFMWKQPDHDAPTFFIP